MNLQRYRKCPFLDVPARRIWDTRRASSPDGDPKDCPAYRTEHLPEGRPADSAQEPERDRMSRNG